MLRRFMLIGVALAAPIIAAGGVAGQGFQATFPSMEDLPDLPGRELVFYTCTACHDLSIIKAQRLGRERWDLVISTMITAQGLYPPTPEERTVLLDYLSAAFPEGASSASGYTNPFLR